MLEDKIFRNALIISVVFHTFIFYNWPILKEWHVFKPHDKMIEVTYHSIKRGQLLSGLIDKQQKQGKAIPLVQPKVNLKDERLVGFSNKVLPIADKLHEKPLFKISEQQKDYLAKHTLLEDKMLISHKAKDFSNEPVYLTYYNAVRSKIYKIANANKPYYSKEGQVKLVFVIASDGSLVNIEIQHDDSSTQNDVLISHAVASIKKASPFPPFDKLMKEDSLALRLTISFEK